MADAAHAGGNTDAEYRALTKIAALKRQLAAEDIKSNKLITDAENKKAIDIAKAENRISKTIGDNVAKTIVENKNLADSMRQMGTQMLEEAIANMIRLELIGKQHQIKEAGQAAASAAKSAFDSVPFPFNLVAAPIAGAAAFETVMSFHTGGEVPGMGDVPILAQGGETVVTKALTDQVAASEGRGKRGGDTHVHMHLHPVDAQGFEGLINKHMPMIQRQVGQAIRRANR